MPLFPLHVLNLLLATTVSHFFFFFSKLLQHCSNCADADLPSVMTCANYLKLPPYSSKVTFLPFVDGFDLSKVFLYMGFLQWVKTMPILMIFFFPQEMMKEKLLYAITEGQGSFHLS